MRQLLPPPPLSLFFAVLMALPLALQASPISPEDREFFENKIRPVLAQDCYECHRTGGKTKGGLALDHRAALLKGGDSGPVIKPGDPEESLLIQAIRHDDDDLKMPKAGAKLEDEVIADFVVWISRGAPDPRDSPASDAEVARDSDWNAVRERRKSWWSFQPIKSPAVPSVDDVSHPVDRFIGRKLAEAELDPARPADKRTLIRRLSFVLRGLPPKPEEVRAFEEDEDEHAFEKLVDRYLESPRFGERWARHWMDWVRYAESHGSEGDPAIPYAWRYRDYLIRALNADVPYDQLVREHLAGDLLEQPRINKDLGLNESAIGTAHLRMVFHGFAPTDALDEQVRFTDDQINVVSKAFLGLTVSCARCHDHKFDAISQKDFYSLYGIFASCRPASIAVDAPQAGQNEIREVMATTKARIKSGLIENWLEASKRFEDVIGKVKERSKHELLRPFREPAKLEEIWEEWEKKVSGQEDASSCVKVDTWFADGPGLGQKAKAGAFVVAMKEDRVIDSILPSGYYSHLQSTKDRGALLSSRILLKGKHDLWLRLAGDGGSMARYAVQNYPRNGTVYPVTNLSKGEWRWQKYKLDYWEGDHIHVEVTTAADQPVLANTGAERSWFGVREALLSPSGSAQPARFEHEYLEPLFAAAAGTAPAHPGDLTALLQKALEESLNSWSQDSASDGEAAFLDALAEANILPARFGELPELRGFVETYRAYEAKLKVATRAPGVLEGDAFDQPLFTRGDHKNPAEPVARGFLEAIDATPYQTKESGRRELAEDLLREDNPFTRRVIVNRVWHYLFGQGIVPTTDNFGRLGQKPSHPELLDYLASRFSKQGWSLKKLIKFIVMSDTWQRSSEPPKAARQRDPGNRCLSHAHLRRLEAEAIRDAILAVSGNLNENEMFGPPVDGQSGRRSVYVRIIRNNLDPFLSIFDAPVPSSTTGRRDVTNVPAQSLTLLNDPFVIRLAGQWSERLSAIRDERERIEVMFAAALGRPASEAEVKSARNYLSRLVTDHESYAAERSNLQTGIDTHSARLAKLSKTIRTRALARKGDAPESQPVAPAAMASWDFEEGLRDQIGDLHGKAHGQAGVVDGALVLAGKRSFVSTAPLAKEMKAKTLEARVQLATLDQGGGGAITVQTTDGRFFDSIVYAERQRHRWMAGSDAFARTEDFDAPEEKEAHQRPVLVTIVYAADGTITGYRDGIPYGKSYQSKGPVAYQAGESQVLFGLRHGVSGGDRMTLQGRILEARLYDRALSADEVAASAGANASFLTAKELDAAATEAERAERKRLQPELARMRNEMESLEKMGAPPSPWTGLAHALFNVKEFIYVR